MQKTILGSVDTGFHRSKGDADSFVAPWKGSGGNYRSHGHAPVSPSTLVQNPFDTAHEHKDPGGTEDRCVKSDSKQFELFFHEDQNKWTTQTQSWQNKISLR